ncbi:hypothetical protein GQ457_02G019350 [Hibiscus cannabinus]
MENPSNAAPILFDNYSGRPPEDSTQRSGLLILERPGSPSILEEQNCSKKGRCGDTHVTYNNPLGVSDMDAEGADEALEKEVSIEDGSAARQDLESNDEAVPDTTCKKSYASMVTGSHDRRPGKEHIGCFDADNITVLEEDVIIDRSGKIPTICFSNRVHDQIDLTMRIVLVVRLLGRSIGFKTLWSRIQALWKPLGEMHLIDLDNNYFLVRFEKESDYVRALTEGPWTIFGSYLTVQPWSRKFSTSEKFPSHVMVWIRLPGLPYRYYPKALFRHIATTIGTVVKVDYSTQAGNRGKFARLCILADLDKPLLPGIIIDGSYQKLEYEGLYQVCYHCGVYGHARENCTLSPSGRTGDVQPAVAETSKANTEEANSSIYGPWMMVPNRRRRNVRNLPEQQVSDSNNVIIADVGGSRFASLFDEGTLVEGQDNSRAPAEQHRVDHEVVDVDGSVDTEEEVTRLMNPTPEKHVVRNAAYMASNPDKKVKSKKNAAKGINVVSMSNGQAEVVKERRDSKLSGNHQAVVIEEVGGRKSHVFGSRSTIQRRVTGRRVVNQDTGQGSHVSNGTIVVRDLPMSELGLQDEHRPSEGSLPFRRYFRTVFREHRPLVVALFEPRISGRRADIIIAKLGFQNSFRVEAHGFSGGIWLIWDDSIDLEVTHISNQFINGRLYISELWRWMQFTVVYASPQKAQRRYLWEQLEKLDPGDNMA